MCVMHIRSGAHLNEENRKEKYRAERFNKSEGSILNDLGSEMRR
jgi:hypothetical protein